MTTPAEIEVYRALRESQTRYTYFLFAAAGAAIGFAVKLTENATLSWSLVPLGIAALLWAFSFMSGCFDLSYVSSGLYANAILLKIVAGEHPDVPPAHVGPASRGVASAMEKTSEWANRYSQLQFWLLVLGFVSFLAWHVLRLYLRTVGTLA